MTRALPILLASCIILASSTSKIATPDLGLNFSPDKTAHFLIFGLLATLLLRNPECLRARGKGALLTLAIVTLFGAFDEYRQSLTPSRSIEFYDWLADTLGALTAVTAYQYCTPYRKALEWKPFRRRNVEP